MLADVAAAAHSTHRNFKSSGRSMRKKENLWGCRQSSTTHGYALLPEVLPLERQLIGLGVDQINSPRRAARRGATPH